MGDRGGVWSGAQALRAHGREVHPLRGSKGTAEGSIASRRTLASDLDCSISTVERAIKELIDIGAMEVEERFEDQDDGSNRQTSNSYTLIVASPVKTPRVKNDPPPRVKNEPPDPYQRSIQSDPEEEEEETADARSPKKGTTDPRTKASPSGQDEDTGAPENEQSTLSPKVKVCEDGKIRYAAFKPEPLVLRCGCLGGSYECKCRTKNCALCWDYTDRRNVFHRPSRYGDDWKTCIEALTAMGFSPEDRKALRAKYGMSFLRMAYEQVLIGKKRIRSRAGYFLKTLTLMEEGKIMSSLEDLPPADLYDGIMEV